MQDNYTHIRTRNLLSQVNSVVKSIPFELLSIYKEAPNLPVFTGLTKIGVHANTTEAEKLPITRAIKNSFYYINSHGDKIAFWHNQIDQKNGTYAPTKASKPQKNELPSKLRGRIEKADRELAQSGLSKKLFMELNRIDMAIQKYEDFCDSWVAVEDCNYIMFAKSNQKGTRFHKHLIIDVDNWNQDLELVKNLYPHWIVFNPLKPNSLQIGFVLSEAVMRLGNGKKSDECKWFDLAYDVFNQILGGDSNFVMNAAKNPLGRGVLHPEGVAMRDSSLLFDYPIYSIKEIYQLALYKAIENGIKTNTKQENQTPYVMDMEFGEFGGISKGKNKGYKFDPKSRNCLLFNHLLHHPHAKNVDLFFDQKNGYTKYCKHIHKAIESYGWALPPAAEIRATIRSVANLYWRNKFSRKRFTNFLKNANEKKQREKMQAIEKMTTMLKPKFKENPQYRLSETEKTQIADQLGISKKTVSNYVTEIKKVLKVKPVSQFDKIERFRQAGCDWQQIADDLNINIGTAKKAYQRGKKKQAETAFLTVSL